MEQEQQNIQQVVNKGQADQDSNARFLQLSEKLKTLLQQANVLAEVLEEKPLDMQVKTSERPQARFFFSPLMAWISAVLLSEGLGETSP